MSDSIFKLIIIMIFISWLIIHTLSFPQTWLAKWGSEKLGDYGYWLILVGGVHFILIIVITIYQYW